MRAGIAVGALLGLATALSGSSVWDGAYTQAQADCGLALYAVQCARCHGSELLGGKFLKNYESVDELFTRIQRSMPFDKPGSLSRDANTDIMAYILSANGFSAKQ